MLRPYISRYIQGMYGLRPRRTGRIPIRGFKELAPHRCRAAPDSRCFLTAIGSRSFSLSVGPSIKPRESGPTASELGLPDSGGGLVYEGPTLRVNYLSGVELLRLSRKETARNNSLAPTSLAAPAKVTHAISCGRDRRTARSGSLWFLPTLGGLAPGREEKRDVGAPLPYGPHPHRNRHPHTLGLSRGEACVARARGPGAALVHRGEDRARQEHASEGS